MIIDTCVCKTFNNNDSINIYINTEKCKNYDLIDLFDYDSSNNIKKIYLVNKHNNKRCIITIKEGK